VILVTGGSGFVGLNVVEQLLARGEELTVVDLSPPRIEAPFLKGNTTDVARLDEIFSEAKPQTVIHLAAITASAERDAKEPQLIAQVNVVGTLNVLEAARRHGVKRFVHASTGAVFGAAGIGAPAPLREEDKVEPTGIYGITKYAAERAVLRMANLWKMDVRVGRLGMVFGRWEHATHARDILSPPTEVAKIAVNGGEAVFPPLGATDNIYAPDLASALITMMDAASPRHRLYHLSAGTAWSLPQWCAALQKRFPAFRWREAVDLMECNVKPLTPGTRTRFDTRRLTDDLGWKPRFDLASSCDDFVSWLENHR
jgi:nucleoside-diphosphate-sugar epimerase